MKSTDSARQRIDLETGEMYDATPPSAPEPPDRLWQSIESAPKDGTRVLLLRDSVVIGGHWREGWNKKRGRVGYWTHDAIETYGVEDAIAYPPAHWMPLPDPPVARDKPEGVKP